VPDIPAVKVQHDRPAAAQIVFHLPVRRLHDVTFRGGARGLGGEPAAIVSSEGGDKQHNDDQKPEHDAVYSCAGPMRA
jgi:hypothetical protein